MASNNDLFQKDFEEIKNNLISCQKEQGFASCFECEKLVECELRERFVKITYAKMNKGQTGGFEF